MVCCGAIILWFRSQRRLICSTQTKSRNELAFLFEVLATVGLLTARETRETPLGQPSPTASCFLYDQESPVYGRWMQ